MEKQSLNVLLITPLSVGLVHGGVRTQSIKTAEHLRGAGLNVDLFDPWQSYHPEDYDMIHLFLAANETLTVANRLELTKCKMVVSPVFFTRQSAKVIRNFIKLESIGKQMVRGIFSDYSIKSSICRAADLVLPNTSEEAGLIIEGFQIADDKVKVVPNGVDLRFAGADAGLFHSKYDVRDFILFVGDAAAPRKNLLPLLKQIKSSDPPLVIIGDFDRSDYSTSCLNIISAQDNIHYLGPVDHTDPMLESAYAAAKVFTLPSQFETPGIAALEAALSGCNIAITEVGGTREIFRDQAEYIDPESEETIMQAIHTAYQKQPSDVLKGHIKNEYSWSAVAGKTVEAYKSLL